MGRLSEVIEPDGMMTSYTHDSLNNLTGVSAQCLTGYSCSPTGSTGQTRTFTYNALSQMLSATNPESGNVTYTYDNNGNVKSRTDGNRSNSYLYDALDRLAGKCYGTGTCTAQTPPSVVYGYDQGTRTAQSFTGALSSVTYLGNSTTYTHDGFGRVSGSTQTTAGTPYTFSYTYSPTDQLASITYPSGRLVAYTLDAADQVTGVTGTPKNGTPMAYASGITYTAAGDLGSLPFHNGITETHSYNSRLQQTGISAGSLLSLGYNFCPSGTYPCVSGNTGTPQSQTIGVPGLNLTQTYSYNIQNNRFTGGSEAGGAAEWSRVYGYDVKGNRYVTSNQGLAPLTVETPQTADWFAAASNRVSGWTYDGPGNAGQLGQMARTFTYDAEDRQTMAMINGTATNYGYDGDGNRVMKTSGSQSTVYVYDAFGNLAAEYAAQGGYNPCGTPTCYLTQDHLGSTRLVTDSNGNAARRYDFEPFGTEIPAGVGGRTTAMGYTATPDAFSLKFTGQERDSETGLDYFHARYYSAAQGRFQGVDPDNAGADPSDPQTWNGYAYAGNNPLMFTDPDGQFYSTAVGASAGGPVGAIIGGAIDLGMALYAFFGSGGGGCHAEVPRGAWPHGLAFFAPQAPAQAPGRAPCPLSARDKNFLDMYYNPVNENAKKYNVDPALVLGLGIESTFADPNDKNSTYNRHKTGDAFGQTGGSTKKMTTAHNPTENANQWFNRWGSQVKDVGTNVDLFIHDLEDEDATGQLLNRNGRYNSVPPNGKTWRKMARDGIRQMMREVPIYLKRCIH